MANFLDTTVDDLIENFEFLGDWEERFAYLIELGKKLPPLDESEMVEDNRVHGCQAMVWLKMLPAGDSTFEIHADSDAFIVKGLIAVLLMIHNGKTAAQILGKMTARRYFPKAWARPAFKPDPAEGATLDGEPDKRPSPLHR
ncbi:MAG: hypothetical protein CM1200mP29_00340 [Verrucomicrobiota bacterium]|nr:MAG: hypothetical protein CM1200mP29_00340 [Verrucomicrobiota bacterium]